MTKGMSIQNGEIVGSNLLFQVVLLGTPWYDMVYQIQTGSMSSSTRRNRSDCPPRSRQQIGSSNHHPSEEYDGPESNEITGLRKIMQLSRKLSIDPLRRRYPHRRKQEPSYNETTKSRSSTRSRSGWEQRNSPELLSQRRNGTKEIQDPLSYDDYRETSTDYPVLVTTNSPRWIESRKENHLPHNVDNEQAASHFLRHSHDEGTDANTKEPLSIIGELLSYMSEDEETTFSEFIGRKSVGTRRYLSPPSRVYLNSASGSCNTDSDGSMMLHAQDDGCFATYDQCFGKVAYPHSLRMKRSLSWDDSIDRGKACGF